MIERPFDKLLFDFGLNPEQIDPKHDEELREWFSENVRFASDDLTSVFAERPLYFKFKAYAPLSFTFKVYTPKEQPFIFETVEPEIFLGEEFDKYVRACLTRNQGAPSAGQRRANDEHRRKLHIGLAKKLIENMEEMGFQFSDNDEHLRAERMRIMIARMAQFDERMTMRAPQSQSEALRDHLLKDAKFVP